MLWMQRLTLLGAMTLASGCVQTASEACDWASPIRPTANDVAVISDGLAEDLLTHNLTGAELCGWKP